MTLPSFVFYWRGFAVLLDLKSIFWALNLGDLYHRRSDLLGDGIVLQGTMGTEFFNFDRRKSWITSGFWTRVRNEGKQIETSTGRSRIRASDLPWMLACQWAVSWLREFFRWAARQLKIQRSNLLRNDKRKGPEGVRTCGAYCRFGVFVSFVRTWSDATSGVGSAAQIKAMKQVGLRMMWKIWRRNTILVVAFSILNHDRIVASVPWSDFGQQDWSQHPPFWTITLNIWDIL